MCLTYAYFEARCAKYDALAAKGCAAVEDVMEEHGLPWSALERAGLVEQKPIQSTADLLDHQPTAAGRKYLRYQSNYDVMVVRKGKVDALLEAVRTAGLAEGG